MLSDGKIRALQMLAEKGPTTVDLIHAATLKSTLNQGFVELLPRTDEEIHSRAKITAKGADALAEALKLRTWLQQQNVLRIASSRSARR